MFIAVIFYRLLIPACYGGWRVKVTSYLWTPLKPSRRKTPVEENYETSTIFNFLWDNLPGPDLFSLQQKSRLLQRQSTLAVFLRHYLGFVLPGLSLSGSCKWLLLAVDTIQAGPHGAVCLFGAPDEEFVFWVPGLPFAPIFQEHLTQLFLKLSKLWVLLVSMQS